ncbi:hypothetical protein ACHQM5_006555 [Ranunculus cassubicifolius]
MEEKQSQNMQMVTEAIARLTESIDNMSNQSDSPQLKPAAPPDPPSSATVLTPGRLNPGATSLLGNSPDPINTLSDRQFSNQASTFGHKLPRVDFPKFSGVQVRSWIQKAERFFLLHPMDDRQKVLFASLNFSDAAETWFQTDSTRFTELGWKAFSLLVQTRFSEALSENVIGEFKLLHQRGSVLDYQQQFENLRPLVLLQNPGLSEQYFVDSCIACLSEEIKHQVQMFYPSTVQSVFALARLQEANIIYKSKTRGNKIFPSNTTAYSPSKYNAGYPLATNTTTLSKNDYLYGSPEVNVNSKLQFQPTIKRLSPAEIQERRSKGLCYNCDEVWSLKHKCKAKQLFLIVEDSEEPTELSDTASDPAPSDSSAPAIPAEVAISLNALSGNVSYQTLLLKGNVKNRNMTMLVDTGSTHNFLDTNTAKALGCVCSAIPTHQVLVAGGNHLICDKVCRNFSWEINGVKFSSDVRLLSLGGCDLVLGVQWLKTIGPITMDFSRLELSFKYDRNDVILKGVQTSSDLSLLSLKAVSKYSSHNACTIMGLLQSVPDTLLSSSTNPQTPSQILPLLKEFQTVFSIPKGLPPHRQMNHSITLKSGSEPTHIRPYRYPHIQKSEIENQIKTMLQDGIIQPSQSPFTSPAILVKKRMALGAFALITANSILKPSKILFPYPSLKNY